MPRLGLTLFLPIEQFKTVHFFGDRVEPGGNDYPLITHPRVIGHPITTETEGPAMTKRLATEAFGLSK